MKENERISALFRDLYDGDPWLDSTITGTLKGISAAKAARKPASVTNSIWEIANHLISWRKTVLENIQGAMIESPGHNYFLSVPDTSEAAWKETLQRFDQSQREWLNFITSASDQALERPYPKTRYTVYELMHGILQHDAYHLGQLVLLSKYDL